MFDAPRQRSDLAKSLAPGETGVRGAHNVALADNFVNDRDH
jgi:hypothetical protein